MHAAHASTPAMPRCEVVLLTDTDTNIDPNITLRVVAAAARPGGGVAVVVGSPAVAVVAGSVVRSVGLLPPGAAGAALRSHVLPILSLSSSFVVFLVDGGSGGGGGGDVPSAFVDDDRFGWIVADLTNASQDDGEEVGKLAQTVVTMCEHVTGTTHSMTHVGAKEVRGNGEFEVTFTLLDEDPQARGVVVGWDFGGIYERYIAGLVGKLQGRVGRFRVDSQVLHFTGLGVQARRGDGGGGFVVGTAEELSRLLDSDEWKVDTGAGSVAVAVINVVVVVPGPAHSPLHIAGSHTDGFVVPGWGGVVVHNLKNVTTTTTLSAGRIVLGPDDLQHEMSVVVAQLRELVGLTNEYVVPTTKTATATSSDHNNNDDGRGRRIMVMYEGSGGAFEWEVAMLVRRRAVESAQQAAHSLAAFAGLLESARYMRVMDRTRELLERALHHLDQFNAIVVGGGGGDDEDEGDKPEMALQQAQQALAEAEEAFFDKSVLALLYFPDEHKYAIYIPLFLPIGIQLASAIVREITHRRLKRRLTAITKHPLQSSHHSQQTPAPSLSR
jgi:phosphatidylinositol glycan class S